MVIWFWQGHYLHGANGKRKWNTFFVQQMAVYYRGHDRLENASIWSSIHSRQYQFTIDLLCSIECTVLWIVPQMPSLRLVVSLQFAIMPRNKKTAFATKLKKIRISVSAIIKQLVEFVVPEETVDKCEEAILQLNILEAIEKINSLIFDQDFELQYPGGPKVSFTPFFMTLARSSVSGYSISLSPLLITSGAMPFLESGANIFATRCRG